MKIPKSVNALRQKVMRGLTKDIGRSNFDVSATINPTEIKRILINRPNQRLGNLLMVTPLLTEIERNFPQAKVDIFVKGMLAPIVFEGFPSVKKCIKLPKKPFREKIAYTKVWFKLRKNKYDFVINIDGCSSSGRLATKVSRAQFKFFGDLPDGTCVAEPHMAKFPVVYFRKCMKLLGLEMENEEIPELDLRLSPEELAHGKEILDQLKGDKMQVIAIFTFATGTKNLGANWWREFYKKLKLAFPDCFILEILPAHNQSALDFEPVGFLSQDVREIGAVIANCDVFVGADSGIMHLASASKVPTIGLFNRDNFKKYLPYGDKDFVVDTNTTSAAEIIELVGGRL